MEDVVQLVEYHIVAVRVMGSNPIILPKIINGGLAEWTIAAVLKTVGP